MNSWEIRHLNTSRGSILIILDVIITDLSKLNWFAALYLTPFHRNIECHPQIECVRRREWLEQSSQFKQFAHTFACKLKMPQWGNRGTATHGCHKVVCHILMRTFVFGCVSKGIWQWSHQSHLMMKINGQFRLFRASLSTSSCDSSEMVLLRKARPFPLICSRPNLFHSTWVWHKIVILWCCCFHAMR